MSRSYLSRLGEGRLNVSIIRIRIRLNNDDEITKRFRSEQFVRKIITPRMRARDSPGSANATHAPLCVAHFC